MPGLSAYCTSKHAVSSQRLIFQRTLSTYNVKIIGMTKQMAIDYAQDRIHINCLAPGATETPMTAPQCSTKEGQEAMANLAPWNAIGRPEDVADAAMFLVAEES